jgi:TPR repeat protein
MRYKHLVLAVCAATMTSPLPAQSVKAGIAAWQKQDYSAAVAIWRPLAEKGDADAQFNLGQAYRLGRGVPVNLAAAQSWLERAATSGHVDAETTLGLLLFQNGDHTGGLRWLKAAADKGEPRALLVYGTALFNGDSVPQDAILGYAYVSRAAAQGLQPAKDTLAELDSMMPVEDRKKGTALAIAKAKSAPALASKSSAEKPQKPAAAKTPAVRPAAPAPAASKPTPKATPTMPAVSAGGSWRIQLGAFGQRSAAEALFRKLSSKLAGRQAYYIPVGAITRLQVGPFESKAAAEAACRSVGQACFPVAAK